MTKLIAGLALLLLIAGSGTGAQAAGSWCAFYDASTYNCGFHSFEQCRETVFGAGGWCRPNFSRIGRAQNEIARGKRPSSHHRIYATPWASSLRTSEEEVECGLAFGNFTFQPPGEAHFALPDGTNSPTARFA